MSRRRHSVGRFTAARLACQVPAKSRMRMRSGHGLKGDRHYDWALIEVRPDDTPTDGEATGHAFLVVRRHRYTRELSFYRCHSTTLVSLAGLVNIICTRVEDRRGLPGRERPHRPRPEPGHLLELLDALEPDQPPGRRGPGYRPLPHRRPGRRHRAHPRSPRELLAMLRVTALPTPRRGLGHVLHWSAWRRHHQHQAVQAHRRWNDVTAAATR
ncbi:hypothetical protein K4749_40130 [Streptomyces sp. TRM72054]|uniref:hypothetical protein n=1 Tax=Streptomyces sp. TRM72054 TaxID=2870562 RepID=UPI001C8C5F70|nr:hypothetical protein [Streptomyces sp. TRM72054]MBX9399565.1 hypothetical protein [Streptomyces sp. TRM72054]